jgi:putative transcriptional regulator
MAKQPSTRGGSRRGARDGYLGGQLLIAMPSMRDPRFARSVIYMCAHTKEGAMGLIVNQLADKISFLELIEQAKVVQPASRAAIAAPAHEIPVHVGGPVERGRGFVLHSAEYQLDDATMPIDASMALTATVNILADIADGKGPRKALLALGYSGWDAGQLEREIAANGWLNCPADPGLVFDLAIEQKYERALSKLGVNPSHLVSDAGHA